MKRYLGILFFISQCVFGQIDTIEIFTWTTQKHELYDGSRITVYTFQPEKLMAWGLPGYTIEMQEDDSVGILFHNHSQGAPHTIHLHGLDVDQANDGVPMTSFVVDHEETKSYRFKAPHPGTYLYHCHVHSPLHVQMGMYGLIIVHPKNGKKEAWLDGPSFDTDIRWLMSEVDKSWHNNVPEEDSLGILFLSDYDADYFLINGKSQEQLRDGVDLHLQKQEKVIWRLANIGNYKNTIRFPEDLNAVLISSDGRPLKQFFEIDSITVFPGERYQLMLYPDQIIEDSISVEYINMNTQLIEGREVVSLKVDGTYSIGEEQKEIPFKVYQNESVLNIKTRENGYQLDLFDIQGRKIRSINNLHGDQIVNLRNISTKGIYLIQLSNEGELQLSQKVFIY